MKQLTGGYYLYKASGSESVSTIIYCSGSQTWGRDPKWGPQIILWVPR